MQDSDMSEKFAYIGAIAATALGLYLSSLYSYLLFHSLIEIVTVAVAFALFILTWNARGYSENAYLRLLGIGYAFIALIDVVHTLAYKGMNIFPGSGANLPTQLWIAARYLQAATLVAALAFVERRLHDRAVVAAYTAAVTVLLATVFSGNFPDCYVEGEGLTAFKIGSEYAISAVLLASLYLFYRKRKYFDDTVFVLTALSIGCTVLSELSFTAYLSVYGFANLLGHYFKLAAFYLLYRAILVTGIRQPFDLIFRDLKQAEEGLRKARDTLEKEVSERTAELRASEEKYRALIECANDAAFVHEILADGMPGPFIEVNDLACRQLGYAREELARMSPMDLDDPRYRDRIGAAMERLLKDGHVIFETAQIAKGGRSIPVEVSTRVIEVKGKRLLFSLVRDITERKLAEEELKERQRHSQSLLRFSRRLEQSQTYAEALNAARDEVRTVIGYQNLWAYLLTEDKKYLKALVAGGPMSDTVMSEDGTATLTIEGDRMLEEIAAANEIVLVADARTDERVNREIVARMGIRTLVNVPIILFDRHLGAIGTGTFGEEGVRVPTKSEQEYLIAMASHMAVTLDRIHLLTERRLAEEALRRLNRELRAISNCNQTLMRAEDEQTLLNNICSIICDEAGYRLAWVGYAENDDAKTIRPAAWAGFESGYLAAASFTWADDGEFGCGATGTSIRSGEPVYVPDIATDATMAPWRDAALERVYRSCVALPLKDDSAKVFGVLVIYSTQANAVTAEEIRLLEELAGDLAFGITVLRARVERKRAERQLSLVDFAMNHVREAAFLIDQDARFHYVNDDACRVLEYSREELLGLSVADVDPDFPPERWPDHWRAMQAQEMPRFEGRHRTKSGRIFPVEIAANYFEYEGQGYNLALVRDITERKRTEEALVLVAQRGWQTGAERFFDVLAQFLCEKLDMDYALIDRIDENPDLTETVALYAKGAITPNMRYALKGTPCENVMGRRLCVYRHGVQQLFPDDALLREMGVESYIGIPLWDSTGRSIGLIAVMGNKPLTDDASVTQLLQLVATRAAAELERERSDRLLRAREHEFRTLAENLPDNIVRYDSEGRTIYVNPVLEKTLGVDAARVIGMRIRERNTDGSYEAYAQAVDAALASGESGEIELALPVPSKAPIVHQIRIIAERDEHGEVTGVLAIGRDITERKQAEQERLAHLRFFENMDRVNRAIQGANDPEQMMRDVLGVVLSIFDCDRAFLMYPCDPDAVTWSVPVECNRPEYPGAFALGLELPMTADGAAMMRILLDADGPVQFGPGTGHPLAGDLWAQHSVKSFMSVALRPKEGKPWQFGLHQCSQARVWTQAEQHLLREVGRRLSDALSTLLTYRNLRDSESRLEEAQRIAHIGHWLRDFNTARVTLSEEACRIAGLTPQETAWDMDAWQERWLQLVHPEDRQAVARVYADALAGGARYDVQYRVVRPNGEVGIVHSFGDIERDESGRPRRMFGAMQDITERKQAELQLRASEQAFRAVVENTPDVIVRYDREGRRIFVNPAFERVNQISAQEMLGKRPVELSTELAPRAAEFTQSLMAAMDSGSVAAVDLSWTKDGKPIWWFVRVVPEFDAQGKVTGALTIWSDITGRKRAEAQLRLAASVFEHAHEGVTITDADANIIAVNRRFAEITGYSAEEVIGRNPRLLKSGRHDVGFYRAMWDAIAADGYWTGEIWNKRKDGSVYPEWLSISSVRDDGGKAVNYVAVFADVSERIAAETALRESEQRLRFALDAARMLAWESDRQLGTMVWGEHPAWALGPEPAGGYPDVVEMVHPEDREAFLAAGNNAVEHGAPYEIEFRLVRTDGVVTWVRSQGMPFGRDGGRPPGRIIGVSQDITERKRIEGELLKLNEDLERRVAERTQALELANRELEAFSYSVSHDLRAPLRVIKGFSQVLRQDSADRLDENAQGLLARIDAGAEKMARLIDDLLKLSRISRQEMHAGPVDLSALAREVVDELRSEESGGRTTWVIAPQVAATGDPGLLRVVLYNLLDNARKYSSKCEAARVEFGVMEKGGRQVYFVRDNGVGFDTAYADKLFGAFQRLHSPAEFPGSGIGLATVARIIHRHGGEVWAESQADAGASFYFSL